MERTASIQSHSKRTILICDDEQEIADLLSVLLTAEGYATSVHYGAPSVLSYMEEHTFDLAILDIMMPGMDGFELARRLRSTSDAPIIFLSAKDEEVDKVLGFAVGADDYVSKPFKPREFVMRVRACLRRYAQPHSGDSTESTLLREGGIELDYRAHTASVFGETLTLTPKEFELLRLLMQAHGAPVATQELFRKAWGEKPDATCANTVMVHIRHLRKKLAAIDSSTQFIETVWGMGYKMADSQKRNA